MYIGIGLEITRPKYSGEISKIEKSFLAVLDKYVRSIFEQELQAKTINGHFINGADLLTFFDVYSTVFEKVRASLSHCCSDGCSGGSSRNQ